MPLVLTAFCVTFLRLSDLMGGFGMDLLRCYIVLKFECLLTQELIYIIYCMYYILS